MQVEKLTKDHDTPTPPPPSKLKSSRQKVGPANSDDAECRPTLITQHVNITSKLISNH